ncbi:hypothetical protein GUITHDRAFT_149557 [Guillardia theta CCMP2712]|uniref:Helicase/UvrB N-terminal domain-containing protein n=1 Tax=Guillardia theta (strain CCMP2712) TaxID=905079 RepID=L1I575_GUITC|nr:hypothetical protein GUITHDRAFT_149557 [Guillardia theta CCMP2712]EKX31005.1 hypothetical protein GUITHDRAFT_149557 [Guillardia theta CCMP2712]|eukprot:XP_005817985.1 hypothetical protein GUITHDRAFT_149557 [Guillardia theta CCMP2712]
MLKKDYVKRWYGQIKDGKIFKENALGRTSIIISSDKKRLNTDDPKKKVVKDFCVTDYKNPMIGQNLNLYEVLKHGRNTGLPIDIDILVDDEERAKEYERMQSEGQYPLLDEIIEFAKSSIDVMTYELGIEGLHVDNVIICESNGRQHAEARYKLSYHVILPIHLDWRYCRDLMKIIDVPVTEFEVKIKRHLPSLQKNVIDMSIYKQHQQFRLINQSKMIYHNNQYIVTPTIKRAVKPQGEPFYKYLVGEYEESNRFSRFDPNILNGKKKPFNISPPKRVKSPSQLDNGTFTYTGKHTLKPDINEHFVMYLIKTIQNDIISINTYNWKKLVLTVTNFLTETPEEMFNDLQGSIHIKYEDRVDAFLSLMTEWTHQAYLNHCQYLTWDKMTLLNKCKELKVKRYGSLSKEQMIEELEKVCPTERTDDIEIHKNNIKSLYETKLSSLYCLLNSFNENNEQERITLQEMLSRLNSMLHKSTLQWADPIGSLVIIAKMYDENVVSSWHRHNLPKNTTVSLDYIKERFNVLSYPSFGEKIESDKTFIALSASMGFGKTEYMLQDIENSDDNVLIIVSNINLATTLRTRVNGIMMEKWLQTFSLYNDMTVPDRFKKGRLIISIQSLSKLERFDYDYIIIDELDELTNSLVNPTTDERKNKNVREEIVNVLNDLFTYSSLKRVIFAEALFRFSRASVDFLYDLSKRFSKPVDFYHTDDIRFKQRYNLRCDIRRYKKEYNKEQYNVSEYFLKNIIKDVKNGHKICGVVVFKCNKERFEKEFDKHGIKHLIITGDNKEEHNKYIKNPKLISKHNIDVCLHTFTLTTGFSEESRDYWTKKADAEGYQNIDIYYKRNPDFEHTYVKFRNQVVSEDYLKHVKHPSKESNCNMEEGFKEMFRNLRINNTERDHIQKPYLIDCFKYQGYTVL